MKANKAKGEFLPPLPGVSIASITPPPVNPNFILRSQLLDRMNRPAPSATVIVAPSGFGKTSLGAQWAMQNPEKTIWITMHASFTQNDLLKTIISSCRRVIPDFCSKAESLFAGEVDGHAMGVEIANELSQAGKDFRLVWDETDLLSQDLVHLMQSFTNSTPINLSFVVLRRSMPEVSYTHSASFNSLILLTAADLKFTNEEVTAWAKINNIEIENQVIADQLSAADNWPAGVHLLIEKMRSQNPDFMKASPKMKLQSNMIVMEAINSMDEIDRNILEDLIFFEEFDLNIVEEMNGSINSAKKMEAMVDSGAFVYEVSQNSDKYKIHSMIRDYLESSVAEDSERFTKLGKKSAEMLKKRKLPLQALIAYQKIKDENSAFLIARESLSQFIFSADIGSLKKMEELVGSGLGIGPAGKFGIEIYANVAIGENETAAHDLQILESMIAGRDVDKGAADEIILMRSRLAFTSGFFKDAIGFFWAAHSRKMNELEDKKGAIPKHALFGIAPALDSAFLLDDKDALWKLRDLVQSSNIATFSSKNLTFLISQALGSLSEGRFNDAYTLGKDAIKVAESRQAGGAFIPYAAFYCVADCLREFGKEEEALEVIDQILPTALKYKQYPWVIAYYARSALILSQLGRISDALQMIAKAREISKTPLLGLEINNIIDEQEIVIRVQTEDTVRIQELLSRMPDSEITLAFKVSFAAMQNPSQTAKIFEGYPEKSPRQQVIKKLMLAGINASNPLLAREYVDEALAIAAPTGMRQVFLQISPEIKSTILDLAEEKPTVFLQGIASSMRANLGKTRTGIGSREDRLTKRELDILRRLSTGLPISQIADSLHISINTIKTHLKNVYRKMKVESREEAVALGREQNLI